LINFIAPAWPELFHNSKCEPVAGKFTLGSNERLKSRKAIEQLFSEGKKFSVSPYRVFYLLAAAESPAIRFGAAVSSRNFKRAVDRNRVKRVTREAYRLQKLSLQKAVLDSGFQLHLFFVYTSKELPVFAEAYAAIGAALIKLGKIVKG
jgi:ribonuclease P protein component